MIFLTVIEHNTVPKSSISLLFSDDEFCEVCKVIQDFRDRIDHPEFKINFTET